MNGGTWRVIGKNWTRKRSSLDIIAEFLASRGRQLDPRPFLEWIPIFSNDHAELPGDIVEKIIRDSYDDANPVVKCIAEKLASSFNILIGRVQKNQLKRYIDYERPEDLETFIKLVGAGDVDRDANAIKETCHEIIQSNAMLLERSQPVFWRLLDEAIETGNDDRVKDYLVFLYSRLLAFNENRRISLQFLFEQEKELIRDELSSRSGNDKGTNAYAEFEAFCNNPDIDTHAAIVSKFNQKYRDILEREDGTRDKKALVFLKLDQAMFDARNTKTEFYDHACSCVKKAHDLLRNHHALVISVENIISEGVNLKWDIYAQLTIFAEKHIPTRFNRTYYHAEEICADVLEHKLSRRITGEERACLKEIFTGHGENTLERDFSTFTRAGIHETIEFFKEPLSGFTFVDCYIIQRDRCFPNSSDIHFIENRNELLLVFYKNVVDERKVPCPVCGSLKISGNSYTEIGEKSWECKNPLCSERSKTNRGKRYSIRTIFMQESLHDFRNENLVPKSLIKVWRKDLVERPTDEQYFSMVIKYFTHPADTLLAINVRNPATLLEVARREERHVDLATIDEIIPFGGDIVGTWNRFWHGPLFHQFLYTTERDASMIEAQPPVPLQVMKKGMACIIHDDCIEVMRRFQKGSISAMITSPPYYNAREYSQWENLYNYLHDMHGVIEHAKEILVPGGVFFYNIGDIYDNERTVVKSTMGNKRIPLGAYIILLFEKAGFTLLDNVAWLKGEPQSNRQKNDGNFVPFYQRPTNCYEHMFVFKAPGPLNLAIDRSRNTLRSNVQKFSPVIKIGKGGVNRYGHTAPFPPELPLLAITCFTNPGDVVFDPYSGSGTTPIAAASTSRIGIGTELNDAYARLSVEMAREQGLKIIFLKRSGDGEYAREGIVAARDATEVKKQSTLDAFADAKDPEKAGR